jgi:hypothetical protein
LAVIDLNRKFQDTLFIVNVIYEMHYVLYLTSKLLNDFVIFLGSCSAGEVSVLAWTQRYVNGLMVMLSVILVFILIGFFKMSIETTILFEVIYFLKVEGEKGGERFCVRTVFFAAGSLKRLLHSNLRN